MLSDQIQESPYKAVAEAAWAVQANHNRFRFEPRRPDDHPSRVAWVNANALWQAQGRSQEPLSNDGLAIPRRLSDVCPRPAGPEISERRFKTT